MDRIGISLREVCWSILRGIAPSEYVAIVERSTNAPIINHEKLIPNTIPTDLNIKSFKNFGDFPSRSENIYFIIFRNIIHPMEKLANVLERFHNILSGLSRFINSP